MGWGNEPQEGYEAVLRDGWLNAMTGEAALDRLAGRPGRSA
jgi:hypothetical protein